MATAHSPLPTFSVPETTLVAISAFNALPKSTLDALLAMQRDERPEKDELSFKHIEQREQLTLRQRSELSRRDLEIERINFSIDGSGILVYPSCPFDLSQRSTNKR